MQEASKPLSPRHCLRDPRRTVLRAFPGTRRLGSTGWASSAPSPASAGGGLAPGNTCVCRRRRVAVAIAASRSREHAPCTPRAARATVTSRPTPPRPGRRRASAGPCMCVPPPASGTRMGAPGFPRSRRQARAGAAGGSGRARALGPASEADFPSYARHCAARAFPKPACSPLFPQGDRPPCCLSLLSCCIRIARFPFAVFSLSQQLERRVGPGQTQRQ